MTKDHILYEINQIKEKKIRNDPTYCSTHGYTHCFEKVKFFYIHLS